MKGRGLSKYLSWLLRHWAIKEGYTMDCHGYVPVDELLKKMTTTLDEIKETVDTNDKKRFDLIEKDGKLYIRAVQGHSIPLEDPDITLVTDPNEIPMVIHGTNKKGIPAY